LLVAFERTVHNAVTIDILGIFGCVFIATNLSLPLKNYSGAVAMLSFYRLCFNAYTQVEAENSSIVQIERSWINCELLATLPLEKTSLSMKMKAQF